MRRETRLHLITEALLALSLALSLALLATRGRQGPERVPSRPAPRTGAPPFGAVYGEGSEGERYEEAVEGGIPVFKIHRRFTPDVERPPKPSWFEREEWEGIEKEPVFQVRETERDIFISMTANEMIREHYSIDLKGHLLRIGHVGHDQPILFLLPTRLSPGRPSRVDLTNGVLRIKVGKEPPVRGK